MYPFMALPEGVKPYRIDWLNTLTIATCHALALLALGRHEGYRAWKAFDWEVMGRLHVKGYITDPVGKTKSVLFTENGARESERLLKALFCRSPDRG